MSHDPLFAASARAAETATTPPVTTVKVHRTEIANNRTRRDRFRMAGIGFIAYHSTNLHRASIAFLWVLVASFSRLCAQSRA